MTDSLSHLQAVTHALHDELRQPLPNQAVLASCTLFIAAATRPAKQLQVVKDRHMPREDK